MGWRERQRGRILQALEPVWVGTALGDSVEREGMG
jgi:hypothetical protein